MSQPHPAVLMFVSHRHVERQVLEHLWERGYDDITLAQGRIAARLGERGSRLTELAEAAQVTKQTAGYLVDQLERAGYVERRPDPTDARARLVCLSDRGHAVQREARTVERRIAREWSAHLGAERYDELRTMLDELREITDPWWEGPQGRAAGASAPQ
jgi:DNA-binding MarR family transcriptional regulator